MRGGANRSQGGRNRRLPTCDQRRGVEQAAQTKRHVGSERNETSRLSIRKSVSPVSGATGARRWPSLGPKRLWLGIGLLFDCSGPGKCSALKEDDPSFRAKSESSSARCAGRIPFGVHPASMENCSNSASTSPRAVFANTWCAATNRPLRLSAPSSKIMSNNWSPSVSSPCPPFASRFFTRFSCWLMTGAEFSTSMLLPTRPRSGRDSSYGRLFPLPNFPATCCATAMRSSAMSSENRCETWASAKFCRHRVRLGREPI